MLKAVLAVLILIPALSAAMPVTPADNLNGDVASAKALLEQQMGTRLSDIQILQLEKFASEQRPANYVEISTNAPTKSIYCVGFQLAAEVKMARAACVHFFPLKSYSVAMIGGGISLEIALSAWRLTVEYDPSRYDQSFDPLPGTYGGGSTGLTLLLGGTLWGGGSGNKTISAKALNVGLGIDFSLDAIVIQ